MAHDSPNSTSPDRAHSRFRLPLWGWFLLPPVVLGIGFVGLVIWWPDHREQMVIQKIQNWGGSVETENGRIISIKLSGRAVTDEEVRQLRNLTQLRRLSLDGSAVTDHGLASLRGTPKEPHSVNLEFLSIRDTAVTDDAIKYFRKMLPECEILH